MNAANTLNIDIADQRILRQDIMKYSNQESDDFFFCHWLADTEEDIHNAIKENGLDQFVFTACYEAHNYIDTACLSDERAFQVRQTEQA